MRDLLQDLRYGLRGLVRSPGFTLVVSLILALAIGANSVLFSFVNLLLLRRMPIEEIERVAFVEGRNPRQGAERLRISPADFIDYRDRSTSFLELAAYGVASATLTGGAEPELVTTGRATASFFRAWGLRAVRGRTFGDAEDRPGAAPVALLSHGTWTRRFGSDPGIVGRVLTLDSRPHHVVGVLTPEIEIGRLGTIEVWVPLALDPAGAERSERMLRVTGRLAPGATLAQASAEVQKVARELEREHPATNAGLEAQALAARESLVGGPRLLLIFTLLGVIVLGVLAVACANVANLVLSRSLARRRELAIRSALGASGRRILRQLLAEGALLGAFGGLAGVAVAWAALRVIRAVGQEPAFALIVVDTRTALFAAALSLLTPLAFSALPALAAMREDAAKALRESGGRGVAHAAHGRARIALVLSQLALACALLTGASLVVQSVRSSLDRDWGFDTRPLVGFQYELPRERYPDAAAVRVFGDRLLAGLRGAPGVLGAGAIDPLPVLDRDQTVQLELPGREGARPEERPWAVAFRASEGALEALGVPLLRGSTLEPGDAAAGAGLVSRAFAERYFGGADPLGRSFLVLAEAGGEPRRVVVKGVTGDVLAIDVTAAPRPVLFLPFAPGEARRASVVVRAARDPRALVPAVRAEVRGADAELAVSSLDTIEQRRLDDQSSDEVVSGMFGGFALLALLMASMGLYASMTYLVAQRTREIGIRMALGASAPGVLRMVLSQGARLGLAGIALGLLGGFALARAMASLLYGVTPADPATYAGVALLMLAVALAASGLPAWRATRVDPIRTLKAE
jgi:putative ABC transport system permease protein